MCYMSSLAVYAPDIPTADEDSPVNPRTEYGRLKAIEEAAVLGAGSAVVLRSTGLYGPQVEAARLSRSARSILTAVNAAKSGAEAVDVEFSEIADQYLHVYDLVSAVLGLLAAESVAGLFNVGPGERHPTQELGRILSDVLGIRVRPVITEDGPPSPVLRTSRLERVLPSWFSRPLEVGVEQLLGRSG
nr:MULTISPECIES: NAD(P)-dependent oxidoreductase [unclassified Mycolicibacterium]